MTVEATLNDGSKHTLNGRVGTIIEWMIRHEKEIASYRTIKIEIDCGPTDVRFTRGLNEKVTVQD